VVEAVTEVDRDHVADILERLGFLDVEVDLLTHIREEIDLFGKQHGLDDELRRAWRELLLACARTVRTEEPGDWHVAHALGAQFARKGLNLSVLLECATLVRRLAVEGFERLATGLPGGILTEGLSLLTHEMAGATLVMNRGHLEAENLERSRRRASVDRFVWHALTGIAPAGAQELRPEDLDIDPRRPYRAFRTRPEEGERDAVLRALGIGNEGRADTGMVTTVRGDLCGFTSHDVDLAQVTSLVGMSEPVPFAQLPSAFREATRAFDTARVTRRTGMQTLRSLGLLASVVADREVAAFLQAKYLEPLAAMGEYGEALRETLRCYLDNELQVDATAAALNTHVNTIRYRLQRFEATFGVSLRDTSSLVEVWWALNVP